MGNSTNSIDCCNLSGLTSSMHEKTPKNSRTPSFVRSVSLARCFIYIVCSGDFPRLCWILRSVLLCPKILHRKNSNVENTSILFVTDPQCRSFLRSHSKQVTPVGKLPLTDIILQVPNLLAGFFGPFNTLIPFMTTSATIALLFTFCRTNPSVILFCALYGFFSSPLMSLVPNVVSKLCSKPESFGTRLGMLFIPMSLGYLIGDPIAGIILGAGWVPLQVFCASTLLGCAAVLVIVRVRLQGWAWTHPI